MLKVACILVVAYLMPLAARGQFIPNFTAEKYAGQDPCATLRCSASRSDFGQRDEYPVKKITLLHKPSGSEDYVDLLVASPDNTAAPAFRDGFEFQVQWSDQESFAQIQVSAAGDGSARCEEAIFICHVDYIDDWGEDNHSRFTINMRRV